MATITATGVGSGLDVNSLVTQLVAADRAPFDAQIARRQTDTTTQISALGVLKSALSTFRTSLDPLKAQDAFSPRAANTSDSTVATASATGKAATGSYQVEVVALASAHQLASSAFVGGSTATVGTGTLTISVGAASFNLNIDSSNNTLAGIRDAINGATDNPGVQATLINETGGSRLVLSAAQTGASHSIKVTQSGGDGSLAQLVYDPGNTTNLTQLVAAQDSHIKIAGFDHFSASNTVGDAIDGVTINLLDTTATGDTIALNVTNDTSQLLGRINKFVEGYNGLFKTFAQLRSYNPSTKQAGPLLGDALLLGVEGQVTSGLISPVSGLSGTYTSLAAIGITKQADGTLALDNTKFNNALAANPGAVAAIFGSTNGVAARLATDLDTKLQTGGLFDSRNQTLQKNLTKIQDDKATLDARMQKIQSTYMAQFTALDTLLAQMQSTASFLTQQLASLPKPNSIKGS